MTLYGGWQALVAVAAVLYLPAVVLSAAARRALRPVDLVAAPGLSILAVAVASLLLAQTGRGPTPLGVGLVLAVVALLTLAVGLVLAVRRRRRADTSAAPAPAPRTLDRWRSRDVLLAAAGVAGSAALGLAFWVSPQWLTGVPNTIDSIWHGYVTALLARGATASPWSLVPVDPFLATPTSPYPYGFHLVASLAAPAAGVVSAVDAVTIAGVLLVGPIGAAGAARVLFPRTPVAALLAPVLLQSVAMWQIRVQAQPPYAFGMALLPGGIALVAAAVRRGWAPLPTAVAVAYGGGMLAVHPAGAVTLAVVSLPLVVADVVRRLRAGARPRPRRVLRAWPVALAVLLVVPWMLRSLSSAGLALAVPRDLVVPVAQGLREALLLSEGSVAAPTWLAVSLLVGLVVLAVRGPARWLVVSWVLMLGLTVLAASGSGELRRALTGPWFMDAHRMWSVLAVLSTLATAGAVATVAADLARRLGGVRGSWWVPAVAAAVVVAACGTLLVTVGPSYRLATSAARGDKLVTPGERAAFGWLAQRLSPGERVLNNWRDGSTWGFAIDGTPVVIPYLSTTVEMPERARLTYALDRLGSDPRVDRQVLDLDARWAIVDDTAFPSGRPPTAWFPSSSPYVALAFEDGGTRVYRLDLEALRRPAVAVASPSG